MPRSTAEREEPDTTGPSGRMGGTAPRTEAGGREPKEPQDPRQAEHVPRTIDGAKEP